MGITVRTGAANGRSSVLFAESDGSPSIDPSGAEFADCGAAHLAANDLAARQFVQYR
jgi:hypothetical protein